MPAIYFFLSDYDYLRDSAQLRGVEEGEGLNEVVQDMRVDRVKGSGSSGSITNGKRD